MANICRVQGVPEILSLLKKIENKEAARIARESVKNAIKDIIVPAYKSNAESMVKGQMGSEIASAIKSRQMTKMKKYSYGSKALIEERRSLVHFTVDLVRQFIPAAIEYGHAFPWRGRGKNPPKDVEANPFARTTFETNKDRALNYAIHKLKTTLESFIRSNAR